jgi:hypothetical protein
VASGLAVWAEEARFGGSLSFSGCDDAPEGGIEFEPLPPSLTYAAVLFVVGDAAGSKTEAVQQASVTAKCSLQAFPEWS